ncbi:MAG TPA: class I SAM-dependent methyltransferase [Casimicrobiaceae bacterium]|nr:class I SAM-dependent methyltransferase [Casimicrobiaceae bacterium]
MIDARSHWEKVYGTRHADEVSWYRPHLETSLALIEQAAPDRAAHVIDVGGGESTLVDDLLARGYANVHVLDISRTALDVCKARLGDAAAKVQWLQGDVRTFAFAADAFDVWHDRAVFHFLTRPEDRAAYVRQVAHAVKRGGHVIVATFGPQGPHQCSGLDVMRYDAEGLHDQFGPAFELVKHSTELHRTPNGATQQFTYCYCKVDARAVRGP